MSELSDTLVKAYSLILETSNTRHHRELHSFIRRVCKDKHTLKKLKEVRNMRRRKPTFVNKEIIPSFNKKVTKKKTLVEVEAQTKEDLSTEEVLALLEEGEEALVAEFGGIEAFKMYVVKRYPDLDFGRKSVFKSVAEAFVEYVTADKDTDNEDEDGELEDVFA